VKRHSLHDLCRWTRNTGSAGDKCEATAHAVVRARSSTVYGQTRRELESVVRAESSGSVLFQCGAQARERTQAQHSTSRGALIVKCWLSRLKPTAGDRLFRRRVKLRALSAS
jgi:hypothetical protein